MIARSLRSTTLLALVLVLAACGGPAAPSLDRVNGTVAPGPFTVLGVGIYLNDLDTFGGATAASFVEAVAGVHFGPLGPVDADGDFTMPLPPGADVPSSTLAPADAFLVDLEGVANCALDADDPTALVTASGLAFTALPGTYVVDFDLGAVPAFVSDAPIDLGAPTEAEAFGGRALITWLYATKDVTITIEGAGCATAPFTYAGGAALRAGWNQVAYELDATVDGVTLRLDTTDEVVVTVADVL